VGHLEWTRSSVSAPMSELEYDLLGAGYASGLGQALTIVANQPVTVLTDRKGGHLYSSLGWALEDPQNAPRPFPRELSWTADVLPIILEHFRILGDLADEPSGRALTAASRLFAEIILLHHAILIPARQAVAQFLATAASSARNAGSARSDALMATTAIGTPLCAVAERLLRAGSSAAIDDHDAIALTADGAVDGDGYGLAIPGWLDDPSYARRTQRLLMRFGLTPASLISTHDAAKLRRDEAMGALLRQCPIRYHRALELRIASARDGAMLAEIHGPLMHVRYVRELRNLVLAHGKRLANIGVLDRPADIVHARLDEVIKEAVHTASVRARRDTYRRRLAHALPPPIRRTRAPAEHRPIASDVTARLCMSNSAAGRLTAPSSWSGTAAAPGDGHGRLRFVRTHKDIEKITPGDVALVPDAGPTWGWLAVAGVPLIVENGSIHGHAPALARECCTACVIVGPKFVGMVAEGATTMVSGDTGQVTW
jgi:hypothetical protein